MAEEGLSPASVRRRMAPVRALLATALEDWLIRAIPAIGLRRGLPESVMHDPDSEEGVKALSVEELARLLAEVPEGGGGPSFPCSLRPAFASARRSGCGGATSTSPGSGCTSASGSAAAERVRRRAGVAPGRPALHSAPARVGRAPARLALESRGRPRDRRGHRRPAVGARPVRLAQASRRTGWRQLGRVPALRHTAASRWLSEGLSLAVVSRLLGHTDPGFTLRVYVHALPSDLQDGDVLASAVGLGA
jgi:integrase